MKTRERPRTARPLNFCTSCGSDFGGIRAFDLHRVGSHDYLYGEGHPDGRRCLNEAEMLERGMYLNAAERWSQAQNGLSDRLGSRSKATERITAST